MFGAHKIYDEFTKVVEDTISELDKEIRVIQDNIYHLYSLLALSTELIETSDISIATLKHIAYRENGYKDDIAYLQRYGIGTLLGNKMLREDKDKLVVSITILIDKVIALNAKELKRLRYNKYKVSYNVFEYIKKSFNFEVSKAILKGYRFNLNHRLGGIFIYEDVRKYETRKRSLKVVDRGQSWKNLIAIAESYSDESRALLSQYKDKRIKQLDFINKMKQFTYPKTDHKWISYMSDDTAVWLRWDKIHCICENRSIYQFKPANYIHNNTRLTDDAIKQEGTIDNVINSKDYGIMKKINMIRKMDSRYFKEFNKDIYDVQTC